MNDNYILACIEYANERRLACAEDAKIELDALLQRVRFLQDRETMAMRLLEQCKPYVDDMLGIASSARVLSCQIGYFLEGTLVLEDEV